MAVLAPGVAVDVPRPRRHGRDAAGGNGVRARARPSSRGCWWRAGATPARPQTVTARARRWSSSPPAAPTEAAELAARLVALGPLRRDPPRAAGARAGAERRPGRRARAGRGVPAAVPARSSGREPSPAVRRAAGQGDGSRRPASRAAARGQLEAGKAALAAGAVEHGLSACAGRAPRRRRAATARCTRARWSALGTALVHAVRGRDEEGAAVLHQALAVAERAGDRESLVARCASWPTRTSRRAGARSVERWLARAERAGRRRRRARGDPGGAGHEPLRHGRLPAARSPRWSARSSAPSAAGDRRQTAFSLSLLARAQLLRGETRRGDGARSTAPSQLVEAERWLAFLPFPEAMRGEIDLRSRASRARAAERLEHAFALACELGDPCWEGLVGAQPRAAAPRARRGRPLARVDRRGPHALHARARPLRVDAGSRARHRDRARARAGENERTAQLIRSLGALAARTEMRELVVRGLAHAARAGQAGALDSARMLAARDRQPGAGATLV